MHQFVVFLHLLAGVLWSAALLSQHATGGAARLGRMAGPVVLLTGLLLAMGGARHDPSKAIVGLYGLAILIAVLSFGAAIRAMRRQVHPDRGRIPWQVVMPVGILCALMAVMAHWPF